MKNLKRKKIIEATIECINETGIENTTIRRIAEKAEMNSAAISYYFDNKDRLIETALETTLNNAFDWDDFSHLSALPVRERLVGIFLHLLDGAIAYKGIARAHYYGTFLNEDYSTKAVRKINEFLSILYENIRNELPSINDKTLKTLLTQLSYATLVSAGFMPGIFKEFTDESLEDSSYRKFYIETLIEKLFS